MLADPGPIAAVFERAGLPPEVLPAALDSRILVITGPCAGREIRERYAIADYLGMFDEPSPN
jgi:hypothetical protein